MKPLVHVQHSWFSCVCVLCMQHIFPDGTMEPAETNVCRNQNHCYHHSPCTYHSGESFTFSFVYFGKTEG